MLVLLYHKSCKKFLSTPSARRATRARLFEYLKRRISIHALREEGDSAPQNLFCVVVISIHALREEGDPDALAD